MSDINHTFGGDLAVAVSGDLATVSGSALGQQRVLRRLLTNAGDYIWQLTYGAGLPSMIGAPVDAAAISGLVRSQIFLESSVARTPTPVIDVQAQSSIVSLQITYSDATDTTTQAVGVVLTE
jgi:phage baseplate assembly protein W